jgi:hypothetical protein
LTEALFVQRVQKDKRGGALHDVVDARREIPVQAHGEVERDEERRAAVFALDVVHFVGVSRDVDQFVGEERPREFFLDRGESPQRRRGGGG